MIDTSKAEELVTYLESFTEGMSRQTFTEHAEKLFGNADHFFNMAEALCILAEEQVETRVFMTNFTAALLVAYELGRRSVIQ